MQRQTRSKRSNKVPWRPRCTPRGNTHRRLFSHWLHCEDPRRSGSTHELPRFSFRLTNYLFYPQLTKRLETITRRVGILRTLHCSHQSRLSLLAILEPLELRDHWCDAVWSIEMHTRRMTIKTEFHQTSTFTWVSSSLLIIIRTVSVWESLEPSSSNLYNL